MKTNLKQYLVKTKLDLPSLIDASDDLQIQCLNAIYFAHISTFPYSNFELRALGHQHPIQRKGISFFGYKTLMSEKQGGYCYQTAILLHDVLEQLGYKPQFCAARVLVGAPINDPQILARPSTHLILTVKIGDKRFLLDPGLGDLSPRFPILITGVDEPVVQDKEEFTFYPADNVHVLERKTSQGWMRLMQTDLIPISRKDIQLSLLKLTYHPAPLAIRDSKTVVGLITERGRRSLLWDAGTNVLKYSKQDKEEVIQCVVNDFREAEAILKKEFNISHVSARELQGHCTQTNIPKPLKPWTVDFPLDDKELLHMEENLIYPDSEDVSNSPRL